MTFRLRERGVGAVVLDIEGTTTPLAFVVDVLFPFARAHLREYLRECRHADAVREALARLRDEWTADVSRGDGPPEWPAGGAGGEGDDASQSAADYLDWLMDRDRKSPGLKALQGLIWQRGYEGGALQGQVFPDVPPALSRWRDAAVDVAIYSSGSELAQRLIFGSTAHGDLTPYFLRFFDTAVGGKTSTDSYRRITGELGRPAAAILFVSDVTTELDAASGAGCQVLLCVRPGNRPQAANDFVAIHSFDEIA